MSSLAAPAQSPAADQPAPVAAPSGADHYAIAWRLAAGAWVGCAILRLLLYLRPSPYGGSFLLHRKAFIIRPLVHELLAVWLLALPFLLLRLALWRRALPGPGWRLAHWASAHGDLANRLLETADRERRFHDYLLRQGRIWPRPAIVER